MDSTTTAIADAAPGAWGIDFDRLLDPAGLLRRLSDAEGQRQIALLRALYERNHPARTPLDAQPRVPKIIHQIWMGSPVPEDLRELSEGWQRRHPGWEHKLWTDREIAQLDFGTRDLFEQPSCYAQKSDILRVELVHRFGGVYVDMDYLSLRPIDDLVHRYDFFGTSRNILVAHLGWPQIWSSPLVVCNSFFGARPGEPILATYLERIRSQWYDEKKFRFSSDELPPMSIRVMGGAAKLQQIKEEGLRTYLPFSDVVLEHAGFGPGRDIVLPTVLFNPVVLKAGLLYAMPEFWRRCFEKGVYLPNLWSYRQLPPYAYANHISRARWLK